jgi:hypothetical protein
MVLILKSFLSTAASLCRVVAQGLDELGAIISPHPDLQESSTVDPPEPTEDLLRGVDLPEEPPPWASEEMPGDYQAWFAEQIELSRTAPHRVDPAFSEHSAWARNH